MIIIEGPKAGGHLGFSVEELESELDYDNEIQGIIDVVKEYEKIQQRHSCSCCRWNK